MKPVIPAYGSIAMKEKNIQTRFGSTITQFGVKLTRNDEPLKLPPATVATDDTVNVARRQQAQSVMRASSVALQGSLLKTRDEMLKTSWMQKRSHKLREGVYDGNNPTANYFATRNQSMQMDKPQEGLMDRNKSFDNTNRPKD